MKKNIPNIYHKLKKFIKKLFKYYEKSNLRYLYKVHYAKQRLVLIFRNIRRKFRRINLLTFIDKSSIKTFNNQRLNKRYFCTYGDCNFINSRERIINEARITGLFDRCFFYSDLNLPGDEFFKKKNESNFFLEVASSERIGGCGLWKPYIILKTLEQLNNGDILVYSDAGCKIETDIKSIIQFESLLLEIEKSSEGVIGIKEPFIERHWTKGDVFEYFKVYEDPDFTDTTQFGSGRLHIVKKCDHSSKIYSYWWEAAKERPDLFYDSPSIVPNLNGFIENRHDQSVWSLICKKFEVIEKKDIDLFFVEPSRIRK